MSVCLYLVVTVNWRMVCSYSTVCCYVLCCVLLQIVLFLMCAGNELFYCTLYLVYFTPGPLGLSTESLFVARFYTSVESVFTHQWKVSCHLQFQPLIFLYCLAFICNSREQEWGFWCKSVEDTWNAVKEVWLMKGAPWWWKCNLLPLVSKGKLDKMDCGNGVHCESDF